MNEGKRMKTTTALRLAAAAIILSSSLSCYGPFSPLLKGGMSLGIGNTLAASSRGLFPDFDMAAASYELSGDGPGTASFTDSFTGTTYERDDLAVGIWVVTATAKNGVGAAIGSGSCTIEIESGIDASGTIMVTPFSGVGVTGSMAIDLSWPAGSIASPAITAILTNPAGTPESVSFTIVGDTASYDRADMGTGYWYLSAVLRDGTTEVYWIEESVRIVKDQETGATYVLTTSDVEKTMSKPTISPSAGTYGSSQLITLSSPSDPGATIMYTNNGAEPTLTRGTEYTAPFTIDSTQTLRAKAFKSGWSDSATTTSAYDITGSFATPTMSPPPGVYFDPVDVTLACATPLSAVYYTDDGTLPEAFFSTEYTAPFAISATKTIRALSCNGLGTIVSDEAGGEYTITGHVAAPSFDVPAGTYTTERVVTLSCATPGATVRYTTDGTTPTETHGTEYLAPINVDMPMTVKAVAYLADWETSAVASAAYVLQSSPPSFSIETGTYYVAQSLELSCPGSQMRYTIDLADPTPTSGLTYETAISIPSTRTVKAVAFRDGWLASGIVSMTYSMKCATPTFSPAPGNVFAGTPITLSSVTPVVEIHYTTNGLTPTRSDPTGSPVIDVDKTVKAVAFRPEGVTGWASSSVATGDFYARDEYNLVFNANGGSGTMAPQPILFNDTEALNPNLFTRVGYSFAGWATSAEGTVVYDNGDPYTMDTEGATLWAKWTVNQYTATLDKLGGTGGPASVSVTYDAAMPAATAPTKTGYSFGGYFALGGGSGTQYYSAAMASVHAWDIASDTSIYAYWIGNPYLVTFDKQGGSGGSDSVTATYGSAMPAAAAPSFTGYLFGGYYTATGGGGVQYYTDAMYSARAWDFLSAKTLYAVWSPAPFTVIFDTQGGNYVEPQEVAYGTLVAEPMEPERTGYTFDGWYREPECLTPWNFATDTMPAQAITLYAGWVGNPYTVTFNRQGGTGGSVSVVAIFGDPMPPATAPTRTGYTFGGYYTEAGGIGAQYYSAGMASVRTWDLTAATTLHAKWTPNLYTVTFDRQGGSSGSTSRVVTYDAAMPTAMAPAKAGLAFGGYYTSTGGGGTQYYTADMASARTWDIATDTTLFAKWTGRATYHPNGGTDGSVPTDNTDYLDGAMVTVADNTGGLIGPVIRDGIRGRFLCWNDQADGLGADYAPTTTFPMAGDVTLYAIYNASVIGGTGPAGGYIFYDAGSLQSWGRYLECAPAITQGPWLTWGSDGVDLPGAAGIAIGTGERNTADVIADQGPGSMTAVQVCDGLDYGGYQDWFLPSRDELDSAYHNLHLPGFGGFAADYYWTSSEINDATAYVQSFAGGAQGNRSKSIGLAYVRAIRSFPNYSHWARSYGEPEDGPFGPTDEARAICQTSDGGYITAGSYTSSSGSSDCGIIKLGADGTITWQKTYAGAYGDIPYSILQCQDGGYLVGARSWSFVGPGDETPWLFRLDSSGTVLWQKAYSMDPFAYFNSIQATSDGGFIMSGCYGDFWACRVSSTGEIVWQKRYTGSGSGSTNIWQTSDGGYILAGERRILKLNSDGTVSWAKFLDGTQIYDVIEDSSGNFMITGSECSPSSQGYDYYLAKLNTSGELVWEYFYGGSECDEARSLIETPDSCYIVAGSSGSFGGNANVWILKIATDGSIVWQKAYGGAQGDFGYDIQATSDGGYIVAGSTSTYRSPTNTMRSWWWILKLEPDGTCSPVDTTTNATRVTSTLAITNQAISITDTTAVTYTTDATVTALNLSMLQQAP